MTPWSRLAVRLAVRTALSTGYRGQPRWSGFDLGWMRASDMPRVLQDVLDMHKGFGVFHDGAWCKCACDVDDDHGLIADHVGELPLMGALDS